MYNEKIKVLIQLAVLSLVYIAFQRPAILWFFLIFITLGNYKYSIIN